MCCRLCSLLIIVWWWCLLVWMVSLNLFVCVRCCMMWMVLSVCLFIWCIYDLGFLFYC